ncbi:MAG: DUF1800 domain-containing protein [Gemmataceae bacterium]|nr:DUF1800 domain-containing protein [Gemmataceae bacterium]
MNAWDPYRPSAANPWDARKVGHLHRRAGFGASAADLARGLADGPDKTLDRVLAGGPADADFEASSEFMASERSLPAGAPPAQLAAWWLYRMLRTPHPLHEKLCLFWHNHFATSVVKVRNARFMLGQYRTISQNALGRYDELLHAITVDPAMLVWLDAKDSKKGKPNENYARELMELFSLGIGNYTETDIREAAKAFTGYSIKAGKSLFTERDHDGGLKTVFGKSGRYKAGDIVDLCLAHDACPRFIVGKLYRFFFSEQDAPPADFLAPLVKHYRDSKFDTGKLVGTMLRSNHFFSPEAYRAKVKSPVEFAVGIVRAMEGNVGPLNLATALESLGQVLFAPPSVKGWDGGPAWLNAQTLLFRQNLALALTSTEDTRFGRRCDPVAVLTRHGVDSEDNAIEFYLKVFLQGDASPEARDQLKDYAKRTKGTKYPPYWSAEDVAHHRLRALAHLALALPEFQLN